MNIETIITLIVLGVLAIGGIVAFGIALIRGEVKKYICEQMKIAEEKFKDLPKPEKSIKKLQYVINAVKEKYKLVELFMNIRKFIEYIVTLSKDINNK